MQPSGAPTLTYNLPGIPLSYFCIILSSDWSSMNIKCPKHNLSSFNFHYTAPTEIPLTPAQGQLQHRSSRQLDSGAILPKSRETGDQRFSKATAVYRFLRSPWILGVCRFWFCFSFYPESTFLFWCISLSHPYPQWRMERSPSPQPTLQCHLAEFTHQFNNMENNNTNPDLPIDALYLPIGRF